jgi:ribonuclease HI
MIEIFIDGRTFGTKGSGITVVLRHDQYEWRRGFLLNKLTTNQLELKGLEYALKSVKDASKNLLEILNKDDITIYSHNRYVVMMLERVGNKWAKEVEKNIELMSEVRNQYGRFPRIKIVYDPDHARFQDIKKRTEDMIKEKKEFFEKV